MGAKKIRLDQYIKEHEMIEDNLIVPMIMAGEIWIGNQKATSTAQMILPDANIEIRSLSKKYVSRGGFKLEKALHEFDIDVKDKVCADFGASTGGFTDVLLQNGAKRVYSIETGKGLLDQKLRNDERVVNLENYSLFKINSLDENVDLVVMDLSFVPLANSLNHISEITNNVPIIALLKPHYEAQDESLLRGGVVKDDETRKEIVEKFKNWLQDNNFKLFDITESPIKGGGGNIEYLVYIQKRN